MAEEMTQKEKADRFDRSMLKVLMTEFMRDTKIPFALIDNPKFRCMLKFMRPDMELPTCSDLMQMNIDEVETFLLWDRTLKFAAAGTIEQQEEALVSVNNDRVRLVKRDAKLLDDEEGGSADGSRGSSIQAIERNATENEVKKEPLFDCLSLNTVIQKGLIEQKPEIFHALSQKRPAVEPVVKSEEPSTLKKLKEEPMETEIDPLLDALPLRSTGLAAWPCLICQEKVEPFKLRNLNVSEAFLILYMNVMDGLYDIERAKEIVQNPQFKVCVNHLPELLDSASHHFEVVDPEIDIYDGNQKILAAFTFVNELRHAKYANDPWYTGTRTNPQPFCSSIKAFMKKYRRDTYIQK